MDEKISLEAIALYGDSYADKVLKGFFATKDQITGKEILSLCNVHQVNLFVIRELFKAWKEETRKQKSAFFDNDHPEVKEALAGYVNVLSNHILIDQEHFKPLLKKAVSQTLLVIFDPYDFFSMLITGKNNKLEVAPFREEIKYLKINKAPLEKMLQKLEEKGVRELPGNEAFAILDQILEEVNFTPEDLDDYIGQFSAVIPLDPEKFYFKKEQETVKQESVKQETSKPVAENKPRQNQPIRSTVNDQLTSSQQPAVMDNLRKISKIREHLSINQKFMFTKVLFYGDFESFSRAIDELDQQPDLQSAMRYLEHHSAAWDRDSKEFHEFMEMVEKRFA
jgi:hypothetical protein